ncbi:MAG: hypothetical protein KJ042_05290 [Deltaproteobacteria bacterium]|nr:hypothetical protein [Deltaproteobacteria bacterium]
MRRVPFLVLSLIGLLTLAACTTKYVRDDAAADTARRIDPESVFGYERVPIDAAVALMEQTHKCELRRVSFAGYVREPNIDDTVVLWWYKPPAPKGAIILLPILGGDYDVEKMFAEYFVKHGFHVLRFERKSRVLDPELGFDHTRAVLRATVIDVRRGIDWWLAQPEADPERLGVCGISMGGFQSSLLMAVESRIQAGVFLLNGGDFAGLILESEEGEVVDYRNAVAKKNGWTEHELVTRARVTLHDVEPLTYAPNIDPHRVITMNPLFDRVVPYTHATAWWNAAHRPTRITVPTGHYSSILVAPRLMRQSAAFFADRFR